MIKKGIFCLLLFPFFFLQGFAQSLTETAFNNTYLTAKVSDPQDEPSITNLIRLGVRAFYLETLSAQSTPVFLKNLQTIPDNLGPQNIILIIGKTINKDTYYTLLEKSGIKQDAFISLFEAQDFWHVEYENQRITSIHGDLQEKLVFCNIIEKNWNNELVNPNTQFIELVLSFWQQTGRKPNFVCFTPTPFGFSVTELLNQTNSILKVSGEVNFQQKLLEEIIWEKEIPAITGGKFSFPHFAGQRINLKPEKPGFDFHPPSFESTDLKQDSTISFEGTIKNIGENLVAWYPFDENFDNFSNLPLKKVESENTQIKNDLSRKKVAEFSGKSFLKLPPVEALGLNDQDFTISLWIKADTLIDEDEPIISTFKRKFREGLHLIFRDQKPYMGFHSDDINGNFKIKAGQWYHVVWRYYKNLGERAIFINGKPDKKVRNLASFKGDGEIYLGVRRTADEERDYFQGKMDDLAIWNRALGDEEIKALYLGKEIKPLSLAKKNTPFLPFFVVGGILLIGALIYFRKREHKPEQTKEIAGTPKPEDKSAALPKRNMVKLFGIFTAIDKNGNDITRDFTPRVRQLFLLLVFYSSKFPQGISVEELSREVWPDLDLEKAANNRRVNMKKLRALLANFEGLEVVHTENFLKLQYSSPFYCDYFEFKQLTDQFLNTKKPEQAAYKQFLQFINSGQFLPKIEGEWLDPFKEFVSNFTIDYCLELIKSFPAEDDEIKINQITKIIFLYDPFNEEALAFLMQHFISSNKTQLAKHTYNDFKKAYQDAYDEDFPKSFEEILATTNLQ
ncbi:LamG-like jellyroll fold domain-containing protein [Flexithrix dorotheae]|uniref:LamG-like jellyroll fold domain-containing protein n=1 Tax=Flexithrix dorotheae TaxID=70993 RepID=UPI00037C8507|nr:LamG-like jellyroll fold domain-containing protein [Flexithrix dorotheae]